MPSFRPIRILLVEDNPDDIQITQVALEESRVANELHVVRDGQEALDFLFRTGAYGPATPKPDLILLDVNLPKVNGIDVLQRIRSSNGHDSTPVIMLTASSRDEDVVASYKSGSNTYIQKPVEFEKFIHALQVLGRYWVVIATLPQNA